MAPIRTSGQAAARLRSSWPPATATDIVRLLLAHGTDARMKDRNGDSALSVAISGVGDIEKFALARCQGAAVKVLLDAAAPDLRVGLKLPDRAD